MMPQPCLLPSMDRTRKPDDPQVQVVWNAWFEPERQVVVEEYTFIPLDQGRFGPAPEVKRKEHPVSPAGGLQAESAAEELVLRLEQQARALIMATLFPDSESGQ